MNNVYKCKLNLLWWVCDLFYSSFVSAYANVFFTTICECIRQINIQISGPLRECRSIRPGASGLSYYCTSICVRFGCTGLASCVNSKPKINEKTIKSIRYSGTLGSRTPDMKCSRGVNTPPERDLKTCVCQSLREQVTCMCGEISSSSGSRVFIQKF